MHFIFVDSIVLIDDNGPAPVRPIVNNNYDDEEVIFVTEIRQRQRTVATIDLCDTPDNSFTCSNSGKQNNSNTSSAGDGKSKGSGIGMTKCPICLEMYGMDEILSTICGHLYCGPCIRNVMKTKKSKCPMCNRGLKSNEVHRIFLDV